MKSSYPVVPLKGYVHQVSVRNKSENDVEVYSVTNSEGFTRSTDYFSKEVFSKDISNYKVVVAGQFAYNPSRINVGSVDYLRRANKALVSPLYIVFETSDEIYPDYLLRYLKSNWGNAQIRANTEGAVRDSLKFKGLESIKIPLPSIDDQKRIAHLLSKVEGLIAQRKQHLQQLDDLLKSVFLVMFGDPVRNEKGWHTEKLESFIDQERGISYGIVQRGDDVPAGVPVLRIRDIVSERYIESELVRTDPKNSEKYSRTVLKGGELLLSIRGTVGVVSVAPPHSSGWNISREIALIPIARGINQDFLVHLMKSHPMQMQFAGMIKGVAQSGLNLAEIRRISIILPPTDLQDTFVKLAVKMQAITLMYRQGLADLESLYGALSQKAFKGELDLSRVPLIEPITGTFNAQLGAITMTATGVVGAPPPAIDLPDIDDMPQALTTDDGRKRILNTWLESYATQLKGSAFSVNDFLGAAQVRMAELHPDNEFELGLAEYEQVKKWVFAALQDGKLKQTRNIVDHDEKGDPIFGNQVILLNGAQR